VRPCSAIASGISELVQISGDLTLLGDPVDAQAASAVARLDTVLSRVHERYRDRPDVTVAAGGTDGMRVAGDEEGLARAITLVIEHAMKHRKPGASVTVRVDATPAGIIRLTVDAQPSGFWCGPRPDSCQSPGSACSM
jgi:signal transduction histidine kinase